MAQDDHAGLRVSDADLELLGARGGDRLLRILAWLLVADGIIAPITYRMEMGEWRIAGGVLAGILGVIVLIALQRGARRLAVTALVWGAVLIPLFVAFRFAGLRDNELIVMPVAAMAAGFLLGGRQALVVSLISVVGLATLGYLHASGYGFAGEEAIGQYAVVYVLATVVGALIGARSTEAFRRKYQEALDLSASLEQRVSRRTGELQSALDELHRTQDELVQQGTLASLGSLVAGISHELNTPIGNARTVATSLQARVAEIQRHAAEGSLRKSVLDEFLRSTADMSALIDRSTERAADLIASFKQVSIDQSSERRRSFHLHQLANDIVATLRPSLRAQPWRIEVDMPDDLLCDSFPGPLGQVLTNLVQNAVVHAFDGRSAGCVRIGATRLGGDIQLTVSDDGNGMDAHTLAHVFEPFFTTKLGRGGSGLGLSICHRLAKTILGGELSAHSAPARGSEFRLRFPAVAPQSTALS